MNLLEPLSPLPLPHLSPWATAKAGHSIDHLKKTEEVVVFIAKTLTKHQRADHVGHGSTQEDRGVKWSRCRRKAQGDHQTENEGFFAVREQAEGKFGRS